MTEPVFAGALAAVVGQEFVSPNTIELEIAKKGMSGRLVVMDCNGTVILKVKTHSFTSRRELIDATTGKTIITLKNKTFSRHNKWKAFRGGSMNTEDLVFRVQSPKGFRWKPKLHVFLGRNEGNDGAHDYRVEGSWSKKSCVIYAGDSNNVVAQMHKKKTVKNWLITKNHDMITVYPNMDYAFIAAIIAILDAINSKPASSGGGGGGGGVGGGGGGGATCGGGGGGGC